NLLLLMTIVGMMLLSAGRRPAGRAASLGVLFLAFLAVAVPQVANWCLVQVDGDPISPHDRVSRAEFLFSEEPEAGWERVVALSRGAIDAAPAYIEAHEMLAEALGESEEAQVYLRNAVALQPWAVERRDALGRRLIEDGDPDAGAVEIEEAMFRYPSLVSHSYLYTMQPAERSPVADLKETLRILGQPISFGGRLTKLDPVYSDSAERGLRRALKADSTGSMRSRVRVVDQLARLLEARDRWDEAGDVLFEEGRRAQDVEMLTRAARDHLVAKDYDRAEKALLAALVVAPDQAQLYRSLATEVYAPRGQFDLADAVLDTGRRNAADLMPLYRSMSELLNLRKARERAMIVRSKSAEDSKPTEVAPHARAAEPDPADGRAPAGG
ncbi:MAG: tetratricopeptide repeat protein, partial [Alphaproteobacteria bacterium]